MKKRILLMDDDPLVIRTIAGFLKKKGYLVDSVTSSQEGIDLALKHDYDLIISDIRMPEVDGIRAITEIQERLMARLGKKCNFMFITGYADEDAPQHAVRLGVSDYILKPFDVEQFIQAVERNLSEEKAEDKFRLDSKYHSKGRWQFPDKEYIFEKLVTLKETNDQSKVYFTHYIAWQGEARESMLLSHPYFNEEFRKYQNVKMITHSTYHRFVHEALFGDVIQIKMTSREVKKCSFVLVFKFFNKKTKAYYGEGWQRIAFVDSNTGKICTIPHYILDLALPIQQENQEKINRRVQ